MPSDPPAPADLAALARAVALDAAALLREGSSAVGRIDRKTSATDLVTEMDRAAERLIVEELLAARPDDGVVGEEGAARAGTSGVRWLVDPLDGTTNYVYGFPGCSVSIAAVHHDPASTLPDPTLAAAVVDVTREDVFAAAAGRGATRNGELVRCTDQAALDQALIATGFSYDAARRANQAAVLTAVLPRVRDIRRMGSAALDLCSVACGRVDGYYEKGLGPWDFAAGALIAAESGAVVGDLDGGEPSGSFVLAAPPPLAGQLRALLRAAGAGEA